MQIIARSFSFVIVSLVLLLNVTSSANLADVCCFERPFLSALGKVHSASLSTTEKAPGSKSSQTDGTEHFCHSLHCFTALPLGRVSLGSVPLNHKQKIYFYNESYKSLSNFDFFRPPIA